MNTFKNVRNISISNKIVILKIYIYIVFNIENFQKHWENNFKTVVDNNKYIYIYTHIYIHIYTHTHTHTLFIVLYYIYTHTYIHTHTHTLIYIYRYVYTHIHYIYIYIHTHTHTHTYIHTTIKNSYDKFICDHWIKIIEINKELTEIALKKSNF